MKTTGTVLDRILARKVEEVSERRQAKVPAGVDLHAPGLDLGDVEQPHGIVVEVDVDLLGHQSRADHHEQNRQDLRHTLQRHIQLLPPRGQVSF